MNEIQTRVAIVDDHPLVREGLKQMVSGLSDLVLVGEAGDILNGRKMIEQSAPDVLILDLTLGVDSGIGLLGWIREHYPQMRIMVLSMQDEAMHAERLLRLGASAYVMKSAAESDLVAALRKVIKGQRHLSEAMHERLLSSSLRSQSKPGADDPVSVLTEREREVFALIGKGVGTRQIADELILSMKTVDAHRRHMREKLNLRTTSELVRYATEWVTTQVAHLPETPAL